MPRETTLLRSTRVSTSALALALLAGGCVTSVDSSVADEGPTLKGVSEASEAIAANDLLEAMASDLRTIAPADRARIRYVTLVHLQNAGASSAQMESYRAAMSLAINSVSHGRLPRPPVPVDEQATVFRIRLDDYGWDVATWQRLVDGYPYNVRYDSGSPWFEFRDDLADELRADTESAVPYVYGDWLVATAMAPPLYYDLLGLPATFDELQDHLGVDILDATNDGRVDRAGFVRSGVSNTSRMIARFTQPDLGALWTSCDLAVGASILVEPVDPDCRSNEVIFTLPNGLPAYYAASQSGTRREAGLSCVNCHSRTGVIAKLDEVRDDTLRSGAGAGDLDEILALYPAHDELAQLVRNDQSRFIGARRAAGALDAAAQALTWVSAEHARPVGVREAAATLMLDEDTFNRMFSASIVDVPPEAKVLRRPGGTLPRDTWNRVFADLVSALDLGASCDTDDAGACR